MVWAAAYSSPHVEHSPWRRAQTLEEFTTVREDCFADSGDRNDLTNIDLRLEAATKETMDDDKYTDYANLPIPTYEEATSSRPTSSQNFRGPEEVSDDAERQGLLGQTTERRPNVDSARSSEDSDLHLPEVTGDYDRRQIEELDYLDPSDNTPSRQRGIYHRARLRSRLSKQLANISATFSSLRLPSLRSFYAPVSTQDDSTTQTTNEPGENSSRRSRWPASLSRFAIPKEYRMSAPNIARLAALFTIGAMIYVLFAMDMFPGGRRRMGAHFDPESVRQFVQEQVDGSNIARYLMHITSFDHVAGTEGDLYLAKWMQERWVEEPGFDEVTLQKYYAYLDYPTKDGRSVKILQPAGKKWTAMLEEDQVDKEKIQSWAWHAHSFSGEATGHLIYANGGSRRNFQWLKDNGVETKGAIALVRYGASQDSLPPKIRAAEQAGCAGVLVFSDPADDGAAMGKTWPDGRWRPAGSVQRGSVSYGSLTVGDPLTPGWASREEHKHARLKDNSALPKIPSLPLAWRDAKPLLDALQGVGVQVPQRWNGGLNSNDARFSGSKDAKDAPIVELRNNNAFNKDQEIWNLHGLISGIESPEKRLVIGSHRDSWCFGAVDPGSGSAVMMELVSIFLALRRLKWRPLRTIEFASWDAGMYNSIGSTEFVEDNENYFRNHGIAYLNVGAGVFGEHFHASGSPLFKAALMHALSRVGDPAANATLRDLWNQRGDSLTSLGGEGDHVAFQDIVGMSSIDLSFQSSEANAYPKGSCYDTFEWMQKFGDHGFNYHRALAQVWALLILEIADRPLIPFNLNAYAKAIEKYIDRLQSDAEAEFMRRNPSTTDMSVEALKKQTTFDLMPLRYAHSNLTAQIKNFHQFEELWTSNVLGSGGLESAGFAIQRLQYNDKLAHFESDLLDLPYKYGETGMHGLPGREQFKHVLFGPGGWREDGHGGGEFPGVRDAIDIGDWVGAQRMVERVTSVISRAGRQLVE